VFAIKELNLRVYRLTAMLVNRINAESVSKPPTKKRTLWFAYAAAQALSNILTLSVYGIGSPTMWLKDSTTTLYFTLIRRPSAKFVRNFTSPNSTYREENICCSI